jgi:hypothetical protein
MKIRAAEVFMGSPNLQTLPHFAGFGTANYRLQGHVRLSISPLFSPNKKSDGLPATSPEIYRSPPIETTPDSSASGH